MTFEPLTPERRRAMTRQHLLDAAAIVFAKQGFHAATIDEIAAYAGFTKGAVYSNFKNKDDLFLALLDDRVAREHALMSEALQRAPEEDSTPIAEVEQRLQLGSAYWDDDFTTLYLEFILYARRNPEAREKLVAQLYREAEAEEDLIRHEYDVAGNAPPYPLKPLAAVTSSMFIGLQVRRLIDADAVDQETIDTALEMLLVAMSINDPIGPTQSLQQVFEQADRVIAGVRPEQLDDPTPCAEWRVRELLTHMIGVIENLGRRARSRDPIDVNSYELEPRFLNQFRRVARSTMLSFQSRPLTDEVQMFGRQTLLASLLGLNVLDTAAHTWDLARATGQDAELPADLAEAALKAAEHEVPLDGRLPEIFAPPVDVGDDATPTERFVAYLGRTP
jgi:uncharacterized protein (TIGR03086 family)